MPHSSSQPATADVAFFQFRSLRDCKDGWLSLRGAVIEGHIVLHESAWVIGVHGSQSSIESASRAVGERGHCIARGLEAASAPGLPAGLSQTLREIAYEFRS